MAKPMPSLVLVLLRVQVQVQVHPQVLVLILMMQAQAQVLPCVGSGFFFRLLLESASVQVVQLFAAAGSLRPPLFLCSCGCRCRCKFVRRSWS